MVMTLIIFIFISVLLIEQFITLRSVHSSFANYYAFRGCRRLVKKTASYGICSLSNGKTIKIVKVQNKWYLNHDLPACWFGICL